MLRAPQEWHRRGSPSVFTWYLCGWISIQFSSVAQLCPILCNPMDCSTPGLPVHHQLPEFTQTHVHQVSDAIQLFHPLSSPSPPTFNLSQHQGLFQWVSSSHQVAKVLEFQLQHLSFQWIFRTEFPLGWTGWISLHYGFHNDIFFTPRTQSLPAQPPLCFP